MTSKISIFGAKQNHLKNLDVQINTGEITVITGVSGSGKSSLAFDTLYAEGQRKYVETFSPYARQFLDRMDKPQVERIEGILPAIAINQTNPVRNSRSSVGTMTELNDLIKLLYHHAGRLHCRCCGRAVERFNAESILKELTNNVRNEDSKLVVTFAVKIPKNFTQEEIEQFLSQQGYGRIQREQEPKSDDKEKTLFVIQDRFKLSRVAKSRVYEAIETASRFGNGKIFIFEMFSSEDGTDYELIHPFSDQLRCDHCNITYSEVTPSHFSFNSPAGACETCRGFGRTMGIDYNLVIPDSNKTLAKGAVKPFQTATGKECQRDLMKYASKAKVRTDVPWRDLSSAERAWVINGDPDFAFTAKDWKYKWYGIAAFFKYLESRSYKMHVRVLLSKYRAYTKCHACMGSRLKPDSTLWRIGQQKSSALKHYDRFMPIEAKWTQKQLNDMPGLCIHDLMRISIEDLEKFFEAETFDAPELKIVVDEIKVRVRYLNRVGLSYLSLDRQSRTLSGGEVQRINLTTALGTSLTNTLFVLDEPSIGLHPHDTNQIIDVMQGLKKSGNTLVVVEHDPQIMFSADRVLDMGPGPGERGGEIVFDGSPEELRLSDSLTGKYLGNLLRVESPKPMKVLKNTPRLVLSGARTNNLNNLDVEFPLNRLVCVTGVSGSGKSTLIQNVLYPAIMEYFNKPTSESGEYDSLLGTEMISDVVMVDQSPIAKTTRSNPASHVGAYDVIRKIFADTEIAKVRGYTTGTFSFNSGDGRCPTCQGTGYEYVEMQFLSDVYLKCPDCNGSRFKPEILENYVEHLGRRANIADVLEMTVHEALEFFKGMREISSRLQPLIDVGLDYLALGQPVPTLSGGESQRLKLAGHLVKASRSKTSSKGTLFLFDEPTTGLHFHDISKLMSAFRKLLEAGHSIILIEHNLDVIRASDWIIDLGPGGGLNGGQIVATGSPEDIQKNKSSLTGNALVQYEKSLAQKSPKALFDKSKNLKYKFESAPKEISIQNAYEHNLKNVSVKIPHNKFTVITGVSGSGKSTLAFDILFNEGQRRYLESLNAYARSFVQPASKPDVDAIYGIPPTVAIEQRTSRGGRKSTVGTMTEIHHFLRLLYQKLGTQYCPTCDVPVEAFSKEQIEDMVWREFKNKNVSFLATLVSKRKGYYTDLAKWAKKAGFETLRVDGVVTPVSPWPRLDRYIDHRIELPVFSGKLSSKSVMNDALELAYEHGKGAFSVLNSKGEQKYFSTKRACPVCSSAFPEPDPRMFSYNSSQGWCPDCMGTGLINDQEVDEIENNESLEIDIAENADNGYLGLCRTCNGTRLNSIARAFRWKEKSITEISQLSVDKASDFFAAIELDKREQTIGRDILREINSRLNFMQSVGLDYLSLDRSAPTLSGGEAQRIRLAAQLGSNLQGVCYVLDEPTIGLHPRDNRILLQSLKKLENNGNTLVVVEHDDDTIRSAEHIIDVGPGAGVRGGQIIAQGTYDDIVKNKNSVTGKYLAEPLKHSFKSRIKSESATDMITMHSANLHNIQDIDVQVPVGCLTVVTGVSGSGKSTLARDILLSNVKEAIANQKNPKNIEWENVHHIDGWEKITRVLEVDQTPIGKTPRSCPATYVGFWDDIRKLFAQTTEAKMRGWTASRFSFNTGKGRCLICEGQGMRTVEMNFLPDVKVQCEACNGMRFNSDTLQVKVRDKSIGDILKMDIDEAVPFFENHPKVLRPLKLLQDVGLGYLTLGQPSPTLSGGEAQRIKLVSELVKARMDEGVTKTGRASVRAHTLYILDEPTVGLSMADVEKLIDVLHRLVDSSNTVVVIEHNLDVMAEADWIIDMGPEGGDRGGKLVYSGTPSKMLRTKGHTARVLNELKRA
ncbi:excinuclease ABC subunit UvrA [Taylorella asinigenitalis]|uniref:excinuclease ABC subunit UvrA n=1 Tax=Taylorella asinigenitalis TaxID=84590 RepID=UPI00048D6EA6|nr:excinuclease ABC subunit UvrA [Taylorella asinigenitalis]